VFAQSWLPRVQTSRCLNKTTPVSLEFLEPLLAVLDVILPACHLSPGLECGISPEPLKLAGVMVDQVVLILHVVRDIIKEPGITLQHGLDIYSVLVLGRHGDDRVWQRGWDDI
jgi:hypothetical protein